MPSTFVPVGSYREAARSRGPTLPRLGSRVRIPSPAPNFLKKISDMDRSLGIAFCFPALACSAGEAWGKLREAGCRGRTAAFGMGKAPNLRLLLRANTRASYLTRPTFR